MPDLSSLRWVDHFSSKHGLNALGHFLISGDLTKQGESLLVNLGVRVVEPDFVVEDLEAEFCITLLIGK